ncbi:MAG: aminotransferase class IV [Nitrospirae bacterium]|nr:aminotransferase class IV [Nitrospirota bacterium]
MRIYLNGELLPQEKARVSVFDRGFLYGDGVFETLRAYGGAIFRCREHVERLLHSAEAIRLPVPQTPAELEAVLYATLRANDLREARIRITVTRGEGEPGMMDSVTTPPTVCIVATPFAGPPPEKFRDGIRADIASVRQIPPQVLPPSAKSLNRLPLILSRMEIAGTGAEEALMLTLEGFVAEGTMSNVFLVKAGKVITPPLSLGILDGITRREVLHLCSVLGIPWEEKVFGPERFGEADEAFLTSTTFEVMPLVNVGGNPVGDGLPGPVTRALMDVFRQSIQSVASGNTP